MSLTSSNKTGTNTVELEIAVGKDVFQEAVTKAYKKNVSKINVPGFRKGKAPKTMIEKIYGKGVFYEDAVSLTYPEAYEAAVEEANLEPVDRPEVEVLDVTDEGYSFKAIVTVKPEVEIGKYKGVKADKIILAATDEEVDAELARMQERSGRIVDVSDRAAELGDNTLINFEGFVDGNPFQGGKGEKYPLALGSQQFIPGFEEQIVGHKINDEFDVTVTFPEEYHAEDLKGKTAIFKVKLLELKCRELPVLDDEFAKDVSEFDTLKELKADMKTKIQERHDAKSRDEFENELVNQIIETLKAEIPAAMVESRVDEMLRDFEYRLQGQGVNLDTYLQYTGMDLAAMRKTFDEQANRQVKVRLALEKIAQLEKFTTSEDEISAEYKRLAEAYGLEEDKIKSFLPERELKGDIVVNKAIDFVRDNAIVTEKAAEAAKEAKPKAAKEAKPKAAKAETAEKPAPKKPAAKKPAAKKPKAE